ncbi:hypothetical protein EYF80_047091 [Liparis tanakae]|uniref:Uncharacterized protein n=1 Tax=Liparis tanakae TaxID=230148 RepID=A0A4Z2FNW4_9TELE|nr:hypothetical protein EYF80_047091 [Liparis tanakae]
MSAGITDFVNVEHAESRRRGRLSALLTNRRGEKHHMGLHHPRKLKTGPPGPDSGRWLVYTTGDCFTCSTLMARCASKYLRRAMQVCLAVCLLEKISSSLSSAPWSSGFRISRVLICKQSVRLTRRRSPSCRSKSSSTARKEKEMEKNMVAWQQPDACEHSSSHSV